MFLPLAKLVALALLILPIQAAAIPPARRHQHHSTFTSPFYILMRPQDVTQGSGESYLSLQLLPASNPASTAVASAVRGSRSARASLFSLRDGVLSTDFAAALGGTLSRWANVHLHRHQLLTWEPDATLALARRAPAGKIGVEMGGAEALLGGGPEQGAGSWYYCEGKGLAFEVRLRSHNAGPDECYPVYLYPKTRGPR